VCSIELDEVAYSKARELFSSNPNISIVNESSERFIRRLVNDELDRGLHDVLFFLDAHWGRYWPVRDELKAISALPRFAVVIDDFFVPGHSQIGRARGNFGFDFYHRRILCWGYIKDCFGEESVRVFYPRKANRDRRGWCLIVRGYDSSELSFLTQEMELFEMASSDPAHTGCLRPNLVTYLDTRVMLRLLLPLSWLRRGHAWRQRVAH
jgi:hypothetical protein